MTISRLFVYLIYRKHADDNINKLSSKWWNYGIVYVVVQMGQLIYFYIDCNVFFEYFGTFSSFFEEKA